MSLKYWQKNIAGKNFEIFNNFTKNFTEWYFTNLFEGANDCDTWMNFEKLSISAHADILDAIMHFDSFIIKNKELIDSMFAPLLNDLHLAYPLHINLIDVNYYITEEKTDMLFYELLSEYYIYDLFPYFKGLFKMTNEYCKGEGFPNGDLSCGSDFDDLNKEGNLKLLLFTYLNISNKSSETKY